MQILAESPGSCPVQSEDDRGSTRKGGLTTQEGTSAIYDGAEDKAVYRDNGARISGNA